jgi:hypothetical protein
VLALLLGLSLQGLVLLAKLCEFLTEVWALYRWTLSLHACSLWLLFSLGSILNLSYSIGMNSSEMLVQVFLARETLSGESLAVWVGAVELLSRTSMQIVNFSLMSQKTTGIREAWKLFATFGRALVRSIVFVHMLRPLTFPIE